MRSRQRLATVAVVALLAVAHLSHTASAGWTARTAAASLPMSTAALAPATSLAAANGCVLTVPSVKLSWTATTSTYATGYRVYRRLSSESAVTLLATLSGSATTSYTDATVVGGSSYVYVVHAYYESWSAASGEAAISVPLLCL